MTLNTWRTRAGAEVDLVLYGADGFWAVEVKNTRRIHPQDLRGLRSFMEDYPESTPILLHRGEQRLVKNGITCVPVEEFLASLRTGRGLL